MSPTFGEASEDQRISHHYQGAPALLIALTQTLYIWSGLGVALDLALESTDDMMTDRCLSHCNKEDPRPQSQAYPLRNFFFIFFFFGGLYDGPRTQCSFPRI